ncbi:MAG: 2,4-dihydroxyhept-2-ene-1,7-dioic acid aldolase [Proteobacteria bacterium]|nr:2,4-dihydroxyhept-2-ene-1,7-dioic acid aldolase [Pseudomonadota bacterium]
MPTEALSLRSRLAAGGTAINGWCAIPSPVTAEITARAGFDMMTIDLQHGLIDYQMALTMLQAAQTGGRPVLARVPWNEPGIIMKCLDAGFEGVICPMVNTEDDARRLVAASRYAPLGGRSFGPTRANMVFGAGYQKAANDGILVIAMIETREALANLDAILKVEGIDGVYVGPSDLGLSMGYEPTLEPKAEEVRAAITEIGTQARKERKIAGCHCGSPAMVRGLQDVGFHFGSLLTDARLFSSALAGALAEYRGTATETLRGY